MSTTKAFVDTTILTDVLLKPGPVGDSARAALGHFESTELHCYAIKEFKAGPLTNFVWFHNVLVNERSFWKSVHRLQRMSLTPRKYTTSTALEALREAARLEDTRLVNLVEQYGPDANLDSVLCDRFRLSLNILIKKAWKRRRTVTTDVVGALACYDEREPSERRGLLDCKPRQCRSEIECTIGQEMKQRLNDVRLLLAATSAEEKAENKRRGAALKELLKQRGSLSDKQCRHLGDAVFAFYCPDDAVILTTNIVDHRPLASALGKEAVSPDDLVDPDTMP